MSAVPRCPRLAGVLLTGVMTLACADAPNEPSRTLTAQQSAVKFWEVLASPRWNERALGLLTLRPQPNAQAAASRILTYLSIAQYRAVLAAEAGKVKSTHPSVAAAVGGASVVVLSHFFPSDAGTLEGQLDADIAGPEWPGAKHQDDAAGEAIGRAVGAAVLAQAATDKYLTTSPGTPLTGAGRWTQGAGAISVSLHGTRAFFLPSQNYLLPPPPPTFGSPEYLAALAEVRAISDGPRTGEQLRIANFWNVGTTAGFLNQFADEMIRDHRRKEQEAARILAYANAAAFDAQIACSDAKFTYWFIRPSQADPAITLPIGLPNHPSYPSAHSCITSAIITVLIDAFPSERALLEGMIEEAGLSRLYGGIHYRFDMEAGQAIGRGAAALALAGSLE